MEQKKRGNMFLFSIFSDILIKNGNEVRASRRVQPILTYTMNLNRDPYDL